MKILLYLRKLQRELQFPQGFMNQIHKYFSAILLGKILYISKHFLHINFLLCINMYTRIFCQICLREIIITFSQVQSFVENICS